VKTLPGFFSEHFTIKRFLASEYAPLMEEYFKFTFVRNPYDKLYSGFIQDLYAAKSYPRWIDAKGRLIDEIGDNFNKYMQEHVANSDILNDWKWVCFTPLHAFTHKDGIYRLDWFGRTENLEADLHILSQKLGLAIGNVENKNVRQPPLGEQKYLDKYERRTVELVNDLYAFDFEFFGYEKLDPLLFPERLNQE